MGIIEKIKSIFNRKSEEQAKPEEPVVQPVEAQVENLGSPTGEVCDVCGLSISDQQKLVHKFGKAYHSKPCFREKMKEARRAITGL